MRCPSAAAAADDDDDDDDDRGGDVDGGDLNELDYISLGFAVAVPPFSS